MGIFNKIKSVLSKTKDGLSKKLNDIFSLGVSEDFYQDLEDVLISSDVSVATSMEIVENIQEKAQKEKIKDKEQILSLLKEELLSTLISTEKLDIEYPAIFMIVGVNGVGKTTSIGKLAYLFKNQGKSVTLAAGDTFRAAASDQLSVWAERNDVRIIKHTEGADAAAVVFDAVSSFKSKKTDCLIIDTAGRLHVKENLMEELKKMCRVVNKECENAHFYKLIVLDATTGQNAKNQVEVFNDAIGIDGIILTKLDGTAKGGFIISLSYELGIPVTFIGTGESKEDLEIFNANDFIDAII